jgi:hypothetical protein
MRSVLEEEKEEEEVKLSELTFADTTFFCVISFHSFNSSIHMSI